MQCGDRPVNHY